MIVAHIAAVHVKRIVYFEHGIDRDGLGEVIYVGAFNLMNIAGRVDVVISVRHAHPHHVRKIANVGKHVAEYFARLYRISRVHAGKLNVNHNAPFCVNLLDSALVGNVSNLGILGKVRARIPTHEHIILFFGFRKRISLAVVVNTHALALRARTAVILRCKQIRALDFIHFRYCRGKRFFNLRYRFRAVDCFRATVIEFCNIIPIGIGIIGFFL